MRSKQNRERHSHSMVSKKHSQEVDSGRQLRHSLNFPPAIARSSSSPLRRHQADSHRLICVARGCKAEKLRTWCEVSSELRTTSGADGHNVTTAMIVPPRIWSERRPHCAACLLHPKLAWRSTGRVAVSPHRRVGPDGWSIGDQRGSGAIRLRASAPGPRPLL